MAFVSFSPNVISQGCRSTTHQFFDLENPMETFIPQRYQISFVRKRDSTVKFVVQHLDDHPSFEQLAAKHFVTMALPDVKVLANEPMIYGLRPEAHPDNSPVTSSYKATFIPGGLILNMMSHHYSNDVQGWGGMVRQLADNCKAIASGSNTFPTWDAAALDRSRFTAPPIPAESRVDAPPQGPKHPDHRPAQSVIFHLPKSKAAALKTAASPAEGWISTYDAVCALVWRVLTRLRAPIFPAAPDSNPIWGEGVNMAKRLGMPARMQGNLFFATISPLSAVPKLTLAEITGSETPLSRLAQYTRAMTDSVTGEMLAGALQMLAPIRDKAGLSVRVNSFPPLTTVVTDWREADVVGKAEFGLGTLHAYRHLFPEVTDQGLIIVYPPRRGGEDEGIELYFSFEKELIPKLLEDPDWCEYFEFRGIDREE
jgi:hypothetical protein